MLPFAAGLPPVTAGSFSVLESRATGAPDVVYLENKTRVFFLDSEAEVHRYGRAFELLSEHGAGPGQSLELDPADGCGTLNGQAAPSASAIRWWTAASSGRLCRSSVRASARRAQPLAGASATSRVSASSDLASCAEPK